MARIKNKKGGQKSRDTLPLGDDGIQKIQFMLIKIFNKKNTRSPDFTVYTSGVYMGYMYSTCTMYIDKIP